MKQYSFLVFILFVLWSCGNNSDEHETPTDSASIRYHWDVTDTGKIVITKKEGAGPDTLTPSGVVTFLNNKWTHVQLAIDKISGDTLFLKIPDPTYLTQQMGSSGPIVYFTEAVYNLTEIPGINYVNFDFEEGDHAAPAVLDRNSFKDE